MKTKFAFLLAACALGDFARAEVPAKLACCAGAQPACCAAEKPAGTSAGSLPAVSLSNRSLYQLDSAWTDDAGQTVQLASLRGRPVVLAMFFASCEYACPIIVSEMKRLGETLPAAVREKTQFVLVSFDSVRDTPAALKAYRARLALPAGAWTLLHGGPADVQELAMLLGVKYKQDARGQFSHSNLITVLNPEGEVAHQRAGLMGDVSEAAKAVALVAK